MLKALLHNEHFHPQHPLSNIAAQPCRQLDEDALDPLERTWLQEQAVVSHEQIVANV
eukprot:Gb_02881 [translate_table: standard]